MLLKHTWGHVLFPFTQSWSIKAQVLQSMEKDQACSVSCSLYKFMLSACEFPVERKEISQSTAWSVKFREHITWIGKDKSTRILFFSVVQPATYCNYQSKLYLSIHHPPSLSISTFTCICPSASTCVFTTIHLSRVSILPHSLLIHWSTHLIIYSLIVNKSHDKVKTNKELILLT